jgi:hypothetical protein
MPRPGPRRPLVASKLSQSGIDHIDARAREEVPLRGNGQPNRSEMIRRMLAYAAANMPKGWTPVSGEG